MFCGKCGTKNENDAVFCVGCGARLDGGQEAGSAENSGNVHTASNSNNKKIGIIAVAIVALLAIFLAVGLAGRKPYEKTAVRYFEAVADGDGKALLKLLPPEKVDSLEDDYGGRKEMIEALEMLAENRGYGEDVKVSFKCIGSRDLSSEQLAAVKKYNEKYEDMKVSDVKAVKVEITVKEGGETESETEEIYIIKVGGSWYISPGLFFNY